MRNPQPVKQLLSLDESGTGIRGKFTCLAIPTTGIPTHLIRSISAVSYLELFKEKKQLFWLLQYYQHIMRSAADLCTPLAIAIAVVRE